MDPWSSPVALIQSNGLENFEDNFVVSGCSLPDSAQYLAVLERRLAKIKKGGGTTEKEIINSIGEKKRDCIVRLLAEDFERLEAESIDEDIPTKWLKSHINPQQPLTISEVVELVKADYLAKASEESDSKGSTMSAERKFWNQKTLSVVTGASQGIGACIAFEFCKKFSEGSTVVLTARSLDGLNETKRKITENSSGINVQVESCDLSEPKMEIFDNMMEKHSKGQNFDLYLLVHNAGSEGNGQSSLDMTDLNYWQKYMTLNVYSAPMLTKAFLSRVPSGKQTCVVNITSLAAKQPFAGMGTYCIGKAAREMYYRVLAEEHPHLDVLNYAPGPVRTDMIDRLIEKLEEGDVRKNFMKMRKDGDLLESIDTTTKLISLLTKGSYVSGSHVDYFDP